MGQEKQILLSTLKNLVYPERTPLCELRRELQRTHHGSGITRHTRRC